MANSVHPAALQKANDDATISSPAPKCVPWSMAAAVAKSAETMHAPTETVMASRGRRTCRRANAVMTRAPNSEAAATQRQRKSLPAVLARSSPNRNGSEMKKIENERISEISLCDNRSTGPDFIDPRDEPETALHIQPSESHATNGGRDSRGHRPRWRRGLGGRAGQHLDRRIQPPNPHQSWAARPSKRLHALPPALHQRPPRTEVRVGRRLSERRLQLPAAPCGAHDHQDEPLGKWPPRVFPVHGDGPEPL